MFGIKNRIRDFMEYNKTVAELSRCTDRELHDIGINRADIRAIAMDGTRIKK